MKDATQKFSTRRHRNSPSGKQINKKVESRIDQLKKRLRGRKGNQDGGIGHVVSHGGATRHWELDFRALQFGAPTTAARILGTRFVDKDAGRKGLIMSLSNLHFSLFVNCITNKNTQ